MSALPHPHPNPARMNIHVHVFLFILCLWRGAVLFHCELLTSVIAHGYDVLSEITGNLLISSSSSKLTVPGVLGLNKLSSPSSSATCSSSPQARGSSLCQGFSASINWLFYFSLIGRRELLDSGDILTRYTRGHAVFVVGMGSWISGAHGGQCIISS